MRADFSGSRKLIWLTSYPKSGNTWVRVMLSAALYPDHATDLNAMIGETRHLSRQLLDDFAGISSAILTPTELIPFQAMLHREMAAQADGPLFCKTHSKWIRREDGATLFPEDACAGAIHIVRNPVDIAPSFAHHENKPIDKIIAMMADDGLTLDQWPGRASTNLPQRIGSWSSHFHSWRDGCDFPMLLVRYEDMLADPAESLSRILAFCDIAKSATDIRNAVLASSFDKLREAEQERGFREKPSASRTFFRHGRAGDGEASLTRAQIEALVIDHGNMMMSAGYCAHCAAYGEPTR